MPFAFRRVLLGEARLSRVDRIARLVAFVACVWFALAAAWGMFGMIGSGHFAAMSGTGIMGENIVNWKIWGAVWRYSYEKPSPSEYFCHHPMGPFWISAFIIWIFGHHDWVLSFPAVAMSACTTPLLYGIAKRNWGYPSAAAATCGFATVPITLSFANFHNLEVAVIFGCMLFFWGQTRLLETPKTRFLLASLAGAVCACSNDWPGYVAVGTVLGFGLFRAFILPARLFERIKYAPYARWWALSVAATAFTLVLWVYLFRDANKIGDWLASADMRGGDSVPLKVALETRKNWIDVMFTPLAITVGKIALPICLLRFVIYRRDAEVYSIAIWIAAMVQYVGFKKGADVHIFWPHYFGAYYALAIAELVATVGGVVAWALARFRVRVGLPIGAGVALGLAIVPALLMLPDATRALRMGRQTGGRFNNNGTIIRSDQDVLFVVQQLKPRLPPHTTLDVNQSVGWGWEHSWVLDGVSEWQVSPPMPLGHGDDAHPFFLARASGMSSAALKQLVATTHAIFLDDVVEVDEREPAAPLDAYSVNLHEPNFFEWYFLSGVERRRKIGAAPDPFLTWEWRVHLDQPATRPTAAPSTLDETRIAYNAAVDAGNKAEMEPLREKIDAAIDRTVTAKFDQGMSIIGVRVVQGVDPELEVWFEAEGPSKGDVTFSIHSVVVEKERWSLLPADTTERDMAYPPPLSPHLWKSGFLYVIRTPLFHRVGKERYWGFFTPRDGQPAPRRVDGQPLTNLAFVR